MSKIDKGRLVVTRYSEAPADTLREWQYGAWMTNRTDVLQAITAELKRRGERSHAFFGEV